MVQLNAEEEQIATAESYAQLATQQAKNETNRLNLRSAEIKLDELNGINQTSKKLNTDGAETQEVVNADYTALRQQEQEVAKAKQQLRIDNKLEVELNQKIKMAQLSVADRQIRAPRDGIVLTLDLKNGQVLQPNQVFGEFAALGEKIIECEVDELYADKIKDGNSVLIYPIGSNKSIATGVVRSIGVALQNKSILYESAGEGMDRRVRKLIISISEADKELLLNDKVECKILL
jgi:multidrug resistance efflux pump